MGVWLTRRLALIVVIVLLTMLSGMAMAVADEVQEQPRSTSKEQSRALLKAVCKNNLQKVEHLLFEEQVDPNLTHAYYLSYGCKSLRVRVDDKGKPGNYLLEAARRGHIKVAKALIKAGAHIDATSDAVGVSSLEDYSPLYAAVFRGRLDMVKLLLKEGASQVLPKELKAPPLIIVAAHTAAYRVLNFLIRDGADPNTEVEVLPDHDDFFIEVGDTPFSVAARCGWFRQGRHDSVQSLKLLFQHLEPDKKDAQSLGSLLFEAYDARVIKFLIQKGADVTHRNASGFIPLHSHLQNYYSDLPYDIAEGDFYDIVELLSHPDPLHPASKRTLGDVEILATASEVVNARTNSGHTALEIAMENSDISGRVIRLLLDRGGRWRLVLTPTPL